MACFNRFLMIPGDWDWGVDPIGPAIRRPPLAVLINTGTWCGWWMMVWFQWTKAAIQMCTSLPWQDAAQSKLIWRRHLFFQRSSSSSSMFLGPSCDVSRVGHVNHVSIWYRELGTKGDSLTQPLHPVPWNKKEYMSTRWLGVWLPRSSCWWACHPTRIALARLKASEASEASPIPSTGIYSHLDSVRLWNTSLHSPSRKRLHVTEGWLQHLWMRPPKAAIGKDTSPWKILRPPQIEKGEIQKIDVINNLT